MRTVSQQIYVRWIFTGLLGEWTPYRTAGGGAPQMYLHLPLHSVSGPVPSHQSSPARSVRGKNDNLLSSEVRQHRYVRIYSLNSKPNIKREKASKENAVDDDILYPSTSISTSTSLTLLHTHTHVIPAAPPAALPASLSLLFSPYPGGRQIDTHIRILTTANTTPPSHLPTHPPTCTIFPVLCNLRRL